MLLFVVAHKVCDCLFFDLVNDFFLFDLVSDVVVCCCSQSV